MITTDTGAKKLEGTDNWRQIIQAHNDSVDAHDAGIEGLQDALGIVVDGDQAAVSASTGQYIILKNSTITGCTDGLYTATKAIPANTAIDNTYLSAVSGGGLNALNTQLANISTIVDVQDSSANVPNATDKVIVSKTLTTGTWIVFGQVRFGQNNSGVRAIEITTYSSLSWQRATAIMAALDQQQPVQGFTIITLSGSADVRLIAYQTSGSTLTATGFMYALKI